ncbi:hypothetical protein PO909_000246 [Leuciscus waleckii]
MEEDMTVSLPRSEGTMQDLTSWGINDHEEMKTPQKACHKRGRFHLGAWRKANYLPSTRPSTCSSNSQKSNMTESKSLKELKMERVTVKRLFSRLTNHIMRTHMEMSVEELQGNFKRLTAEGSKVMDVNEEIEAAYIAQCEETDPEGAPELSDQQRADLEKTEKECEQKLKVPFCVIPCFKL